MSTITTQFDVDESLNLDTFPKETAVYTYTKAGEIEKV